MRLDITCHEFKHQIPEDFRWWMFTLRMFEESFKDSRFKKLWAEDPYFHHGVDVWMAEADGVPCGILVHEKDNRELPMAYTRLIGSKWTKPVLYPEHFTDFGRIGFFTKPEFRNQEIARKLLESMETRLESRNMDAKFPVIAALDRAFNLVDKNSQWMYPLPTANPSFIRKTRLSDLSRDISWFTKAISYQDEPGPYHRTRWRKGRTSGSLDIHANDPTT